MGWRVHGVHACLGSGVWTLRETHYMKIYDKRKQEDQKMVCWQHPRHFGVSSFQNVRTGCKSSFVSNGIYINILVLSKHAFLDSVNTI